MPLIIDLPPKYYLDHFREFISSLKDLYHPFLGPLHRDFLDQFEALSENSQCLYVRLINRKGHVFFSDSLHYEEIIFDDAFLELSSHSFARKWCKDDWPHIVRTLPKQKLHDFCREFGIKVKKSISRTDLESELLNFSPLMSSVLDSLVFQERVDELRYLLFLYFGKIEDNLSLYTLRDLGIRKVNKSKVSWKPRFKSQEEALSQYFYFSLLENPDESDEYLNWPKALNPETLNVREALLLNLADKRLEQNLIEDALHVYEACTLHPAREKMVRLLYQLDRKEECKVLLEKILDYPVSDLECLFAQDFLERKFHKKKTSILTDTLRRARKISIDESWFRHPEDGVISHLKDQGIESFHIENYVWNALLGLLFWEELFESEATSLFNPFERLPAELMSGEFYNIHQEAILKKFKLLQNEDFLSWLKTRAEEKKDIPNGIFGWHPDIFFYLEKLVSHSSSESLSVVLFSMLKNYSMRSTGFPDLMSIENGKLKFYEVKAKGDSLKETQLLQIELLKKAHYEVEVLQVDYSYNPNQLYVVVDLETTGALMPFHRITEIGAVKIQSGVVIDRYQTLVNPSRSISREIQELTGITNDMVKDAPVFKDVMDAFDEFTKGAIFVAHNVGFDYGFLQAEFERQERKFVRPFICTKVGMKKHYPGLPSYGLKNLCAHFKVSLDTHHRALCDAEAASGLLTLINRKRAEESLNTSREEVTKE